MKKRGSGILCHVASFPSKFGIGDFGQSAYFLIDFLKEAKQSFLQLLPLTPVEAYYDYSPYHSTSAFALNYLFIDPDELWKEGLIDDSYSEPLIHTRDEKVDYTYAVKFKKQILQKAFSNFSRIDKSKFEEFESKNSYWLEDYALFESIKRKYDNKAWFQWPDELKYRKESAIKSAREALSEDILFEKFVQFIALSQWNKLREYASSRNIQIIGDMPIYVDHNSSDVWCNSQYFKLNEDGSPIFVAGVPPDYFSSTGQLWGNPVYNWDKLKEDSFGWWAKRFLHNLTLYDFVRIDHFRGLVAYWEVPAYEKTAVNGQWQQAPVYEFFDTIIPKIQKFNLIAEDLGVITEDVVKVMKYYGFPGMKVLQFAFEGDPSNAYLPHNYTRNTIVYTGTHDNNTTIGWYKEEASKMAKDFLCKYLGKEINENNVNWELIRLAMSSVSDTAIIPIQDVLGKGSNFRMNTPGTATNNWRFSFGKEEITDEIKDRLREFTEIYGRSL